MSRNKRGIDGNGQLLFGPPDQGKRYGVREIAEVTCAGESTVRYWIRKGWLEAELTSLGYGSTADQWCRFFFGPHWRQVRPLAWLATSRKKLLTPYTRPI